MSNQAQLTKTGNIVTLADGRTAKVISTHRTPGGLRIVSLWTEDGQQIVKPLRLIKLG